MTADPLPLFDAATHSPLCLCSEVCQVTRRNGWDPARIIRDWDNRPADCTCTFKGLPGDGVHTSHVDERISDEAIRDMASPTVEPCPAERRALIRCLVRRH